LNSLNNSERQILMDRFPVYTLNSAPEASKSALRDGWRSNNARVPAKVRCWHMTLGHRQPRFS
jgi:hypothetical protein